MIARVVNNQLRERREALGLTQKALAKRMGVHYRSISFYESMRLSPRCRARSGPKTEERPWVWRRSALRLARFFGVKPHELFPEVIHEVQRTTTERRFDAHEMFGLPGTTPSVPLLPDAVIEEQERTTAIEEVLSSLTPRERETIRHRFGFDGDPDGMTFKELGGLHGLGLSAERMRQVCNKAMHKLRHPSRSAKLKAFF